MVFYFSIKMTEDNPHANTRVRLINNTLPESIRL